MFLRTFEDKCLSSYSWRSSILPKKFFFSFSIKSLERKVLSHLWRMAGREFLGIGTVHSQWWWLVRQEAHSSFQERRRKQQLPFHFQNPKPHNRASPWHLSQSPVPLQTANKFLNQHTVWQPGHRFSHARFPKFLMVVQFIGFWPLNASTTLLSLCIAKFPSLTNKRYIVLENTVKINVYMFMSQNLDQISRGSSITSY